MQEAKGIFFRCTVTSDVRQPSFAVGCISYRVVHRVRPASWPQCPWWGTEGPRWRYSSPTSTVANVLNHPTIRARGMTIAYFNR